MWIITATEYFTKWVEAAPLRKATGLVVAQFIQDHKLSRFGLPQRIITDNGTQFCNQHVDGLLEKYKVKHDRTTPYNPQTNGQAKAMNRILLGIWRRTVCENQRDWHVKLFTALLAYRTSARMSIGVTPYFFWCMARRQCYL